MKNISTGTGLVVLGLGVALHPLVSGLIAQATAAPSSAAAAVAVASAATSQAEPTVVWYGVENYLTGGSPASFPTVWRAWSDGTIEYSMRRFENCALVPVCQGLPTWQVHSTPNEGFRSAADVGGDQRVDGADLASVLSNWGDAPRVPFPPSDCPLNLINP